jgi:acetyl-CoA carboxylase beta subunit
MYRCVDAYGGDVGRVLFGGKNRIQTEQSKPMLDTFKKSIQFAPVGGVVGNLLIGRGVLEQASAHVAVIENRITSGALGVVECDKLSSLFKVAAAQKAAIVLYIDSAGARVSEGLPALGAFRRMYASALKASLAGAPMIAVIGTNCFGGASMLAALCGARYYSAQARLAMSGPSILAAANGVSAIDAAFHAMAEASIGTLGRTQLDSLKERDFGVLALPEIDAPRWRHDALVSRLRAAGQMVSLVSGAGDAIRRKDLALLYPEGYELSQQDGIVVGIANVDHQQIRLLGTLDKRPITALRASMLTEQILALQRSPPARLDILMDCETHSAALNDEKVMLSSFLSTLSQVLMNLRNAGTLVQTIVLGRLGGGIYVSLAAASSEVNIVHGGEIQLLPAKTIAAILGENSPSTACFDDYRHAGVAEREIKLGMTA